MGDNAQTKAKKAFSKPIREAFHRHKRYATAVDCWHTFTKAKGERLLLWSFIRHEVDAVHQRRQEFRHEESERATFSWENIGQNMEWLLSGGKTNFSDLESALGVETSVKTIRGQARIWYKSFHIDEQKMRQFFNENSDRAIPELRDSAVGRFTSSSYCEFINFGIKVAVHQALLEWTAYRLRSWILFYDEEVNSSQDLQDFQFSTGSQNLIRVPFQRKFFELAYPEQVSVIEQITEDLQKSNTGLQLLRELTTDDIPGLNLLCLYDEQKNSNQFEYRAERKDFSKGIVRSPTDSGVGKTFEKETESTDRHVLTGEGLSPQLIKIGTRLLCGVTRRVGDRGRATHTSEKEIEVTALDHSGKVKREEFLKEVLEQYSEVTGVLLGASATNAELATRIDGWSESDVHRAIDEIRNAGRSELKISGGPAPPETADLSPYDEVIHDIAKWHGYVETFQSALSESLDPTKLPRPKGYTAALGVLQSTVGGALFVYDMVFADDMSNQRRNTVDGLSAAFGAVSETTSFYQGLETVATSAVRVRDGEKVDEFVEELSSELEPGEDALNNPNLDLRLRSINNVAAVYDAGMTAYQSYRLFEVGDEDAAFVAATMATVGAAELAAEVCASGLMGGPAGVAVALVQIGMGIWLQHLKDAEIITWMNHTHFGSEHPSNSGSETAEDPETLFFHFYPETWVSTEDALLRQLSAYLSIKIGFSIPGQQAVPGTSYLLGPGGLELFDHRSRGRMGTLTLNRIKHGAPSSTFHIKPIITKGDHKEVTVPKHSVEIPPIPHPAKTKRKGWIVNDIEPDKPSSGATWHMRGLPPHSTRLMLQMNNEAVDTDKRPSADFRTENTVWGVEFNFYNGSDTNYFVEKAKSRTWGVEVVHETPEVKKAMRSFLNNALTTNQRDGVEKLVDRMPYPREPIGGDWW